MKVSTKISGGAIQYVIVLSVIIIILLFSFISLIFLQKRTVQKSDLYLSTIRAVYSSFDYLNQHQIPYDTETEVKFSKHSFEDTRIIRKHWGLFDLGIAKSTLKNETFQKVALLGNHRENRRALYLQENNQALVLVGNTTITGDAILSKKGVKTGNITGTSYYGKQLIYGNILPYASRLPDVASIPYLKSLLLQGYEGKSELLTLEENTTIRQAFTAKTLVFETDKALDLSNIHLQGNIIVKSAQRILINASANLKDILVIAPEIVVASGSNISCQLIASKRIRVEKNAALTYPSAIAVVKDQTTPNKEQEPEIHIANNTSIRGPVLFFSDNQKVAYKAHLLIEKDAVVHGEVYCNKNLELQGTVNGFVFADMFITHHNGSIFLNHLYNGVINSEGISAKYVGLFVEDENTKVAKWIE